MMNLPLIIFDEECPLCHRFKKALTLMDTKNKLNFVSVNDEEVFKQYPKLSVDECLSEVHLIDEEENIYRGAEVITYLVKFYPLVNKLAWLIDSESGKKAMDMFYGQINNMRKMKKKNCFRCGK